MGRKILPLKDEYFDWLLNGLLGKKVFSKYEKLCKELHKKKFRWSVSNDDNRCEDGIQLREQFVEMLSLDETHLEVKHFLKGDCTIFELLVALSQRINHLMYDLRDQENHTARWFLEMIRNLNLESYVDSSTRSDILDEMDAIKIDDILETFMDRTYAYDGTGGLFPLKRRPLKDQSGVEIWYQLMLYLDENYGY